MPEQLPLFPDADPSRAPDAPAALTIPEALGEELAQRFTQVLARLLAVEAEPPR